MNFSEERVREILLGRRAVRTIDMPGFPGVKVGIRILYEFEIDSARVEAAKYVRDRAKEVLFDAAALLAIEPELFDRECQRQVLQRAVIDADSDPTSPRPFFPSDLDVRQLDSVTVRALWDAYAEHQEWVSPRYSLSDEDVEKLVDALGKESAPGVTLAHFERDTLESCVRSMASRLRAR